MSWLKSKAPNQKNQDPDSINVAIAAAAFAIHSLEEYENTEEVPTTNLPQSDMTRLFSFNKTNGRGEISKRQLTAKNHKAPDRVYSDRKLSSPLSNRFTTSEDIPGKPRRNGKPKSLLSWANEKVLRATTKFGSRKIQSLRKTRVDVEKKLHQVKRVLEG